MELREQKIKILKKEFEAIDINHDELLSKEEFFRSLDLKVNDVYDRNIAEQLFERMDRDCDNRITIEEFISVFLEAEDVLSRKIEKTKKIMEEASYQRDEASLQLQKNLRTEILNNFGIMTDSFLTITIVEAQNLTPIRSQNWNMEFHSFALITCGGVTAQTQTVGSLNPIWNETFSLEIQTGQEIIVLTVKEDNSNNIEENLGQLSINLGFLQDQEKHEEWANLYDVNGNALPSKILISMQWIYSKVKYYQNTINKWDIDIIAHKEDLESFELDLKKLYDPFQGLIHLYNQEKGEYGRSKYERNDAIMISEKIKESSWRNIFKIEGNIILISITALYFLFTIMVCFNRSVFIDIILCSVIFLSSYYRTINDLIMKFIGSTLFFSIILDLAWIIIYTNGWWIPTDNTLADLNIDLDLKRYCVVMSYILFFTKIIYLSIFIYFMINFSNKIIDSPVKKEKINLKYSTNFNRVDY